MTTSSFAVSWDYRCPFARVAHKHVVLGLRDGAPWEVHWVPFSLKQTHVEEGQPDVWDRPDDDSGLVALQVAIAVRDGQPDRFLDVHEALFDARHVDGRDLRDEATLRQVLEENGADADAAFADVASGDPLQTVRKEHEAFVETHNLWGVPTFVSGDRAIFVRLMEPPGADPVLARATVERLLDLVTGWPELNEFKATSIPR